MTWFTRMSTALLLAVGMMGLSGCETVASTAPLASSADAKGIIIHRPWARATPGSGQNGVVFLTITNRSDLDDRLVAAYGTMAQTIELHTHVLDGPVMKMRAVPYIDIPKGQSVELRPGGLHIMLIQLQSPLKEGSSFPLTLELAHAGRMSIDVIVKGSAITNGQDHTTPSRDAPLPHPHGH
ncbi:MAG: copper chaperone PCu(A)C [Magnetococcales bacterium]|nr:copper chaperone PCu(A)C [Magnetococcales bacterium]